MAFPSKEVKTLYWVGCLTLYRLPHVAKATVSALKKMDVDPILLGEDEGCCGGFLLSTGQIKEALKNAKKVVKIIEERKPEVLVTECAGCYSTFTKGLTELGISPNFQVMHTSQFVENLINSRVVGFKKLNIKVTYYDPCRLGRISGVYDSPRNVLKAIPGLKLVEMENSRSEARCCGAGGGVFSVFKRLARNIGRDVILNDVLPTGAEALVTTCPTCQLNFSYTVKWERMPLKVYDLMEIIDMAL
jgi:heterodisulfide reductase subunit D